MEALRIVGRADLSLGRIFEGHVNACALIRWYGSLAQLRQLERSLSTGQVYGVWNTEQPQGVRLCVAAGEPGRLVGAKTFATGGGFIDWAIVTARPEVGDPVMVLAPASDPLRARPETWQVRGMRGTVSGAYDLTGVAATAYESAALDGGALDFVDKARGVPILAKRLHLILDSRQRTAQNPSKQGLRCGKLVLRPDASRAYWADHDVDLTVTEFNIVHLMASHAGEHVTYRSIYDCVHHAGFLAGSGDEGFRTNVRSSIKRIRNKFRSLDNEFAEIENFPAFGYRWRNGPAQPA